MGKVPRAQVYPNRPGKGHEVDTVVVVELGIFDGDHRILHVVRKLGDIGGNAVFPVEVSNDPAVDIVYVGSEILDDIHLIQGWGTAEVSGKKARTATDENRTKNYCDVKPNAFGLRFCHDSTPMEHFISYYTILVALQPSAIWVARHIDCLEGGRAL